MKKKELLLVIIILLFAACIWVFSKCYLDDSGEILRITVNNEIYGEYSLQEDQVVSIGDTNVCEIKDGEVRMIEADCPDQLCVETKAVTSQGGTIICLPNRVFLEVVPKEGTDAPDTVAS